MAFPACPSCSFPDVPVADRSGEIIVEAIPDSEPNALKRTITVHRSYRCSGCLETFWTIETVETVNAKTHKIQHLYRSPLR